MVATAGVGLSEPILEDGAVYWHEQRPAEAGRGVVVRGGPWSSPIDVSPEGVDVRTRVHEYGGGAWCVRRGVLVYSDDADGRLWRLDPHADAVPITPDSGGLHRYADGRLTDDGTRWIGVRERHDRSGRVADVVNELVAVPVNGAGDPSIIAEGRDFYANPRISGDGGRLAWLAWDLPWMPWDGCELFVADLDADGSLANERHVVGRDGEESIWQPAWGPNGDLVFASDRSGWWNLERLRGHDRSVLHPMEAEFGYPQWVFGGSSYAILPDGRIACWYGDRGVQHLALLDPESGELLDLDLPYRSFEHGPAISAGATRSCSSPEPDMPSQVVWADLGSRAVEVLRESVEVRLDAADVSAPHQIEFPTEHGLTAFAHLYPPTNHGFAGPDGQRPPLIVTSHGGPTSEATATLDLGIQFWTTRGFALVDVNYGGSTGFGRAYRRRLNGNWGSSTRPTASTRLATWLRAAMSTATDC